LPHTLAESSSETGGRLDLGVDVKRPLPSGLRLYGTYNPDFRNIEDVVETVDFTYTERRLPERRPFFAESWAGSSGILYTRRIGEVKSGLAVSGRVERHRPALLLVDTVDQGNLLAAFYTYFAGASSSATFALADVRGAEEPDNVAGMVSLDYGRNTDVGNDYARVRYFRSNTAGEGGDGDLREAMIQRRRGPGRISFWASLSEVAPDYNAALALVSETGIRRLIGGTDWWKRHEQGRVRDIWWWTSFERVRSIIGDPPYHSVEVGGGREFRNHTSQWLNVRHGRREGFTDAGVGLGCGWNSDDLYRSGSVSLDVGERLGGSSLFASAGQGIKLSEYAALQVRAEYLRMTAPTSPARRHQIVVTGTYDLSDEKTISGRMVEREEGFNIYFTYRQAVRRGMDAYVIVGDPNAEKFERRIAVKTIWAMFP